MYENIITKEFYTIWKKYKPVVLKMMIDSLDGSFQEYQFMKHEFTDVNPKKNASCSFKLQIYKGRNMKLTPTTVIATDLIAMLKQSIKGTELMKDHIFTISLNTSFKLLVSSEGVSSE